MSQNGGDQEALDHLRSLLAAISEADASRQVPMLRAWLEHAIDRVEAVELSFYDFLSECALLAGENMQDVRLQFVERRLDDLENPPGPTLRDVLVAFAIVLAVELAVVAAVHAAIPALIGGAVAGVAGARRFRALAKSGAPANRKKALSILEDAAADISATEETLNKLYNAFERNLITPEPGQNVTDMIIKAQKLQAAVERDRGLVAAMAGIS